MSTNRERIMMQIQLAKANPMLIKKAGIEMLRDMSNGAYEIGDPNNPLSYLMEFTACAHAVGLQEGQLGNRRQYPEVAQTQEDLYNHMSTADYLDRFSTPSGTTLTISISRDEVIAKSVPTGESGVRRLTLPRNTMITVDGIPFSIQYPVDIRVLANGRFHIVYNNDRPSPMQALESNQVDWSIENYFVDRENRLHLRLPVKQFGVSSKRTRIDGGRVFSKTFEFQDQYYFCRVYHQVGNEWVEIRTTHSDQVFNPQMVTALLRVSDNKLTVTVPQVYVANGMVGSNIRTDIYYTRGPLEMTLSGYDANSFVANWRDFDEDDGGRFTSPFAALSTLWIVNEGYPVTGGTNALSFDNLKSRVINNSLGTRDTPITESQIRFQLDKLTDIGFSCITAIDNVTRRLFLATRILPDPENIDVSSGIGSNVLGLRKTTNEIISFADVMDNGERITILPTTLYRNVNGRLEIVQAPERQIIMEMEGDLKTEMVNTGRFMYSPFHYVYDTTENLFRVRPYYFGKPSIGRRFFVDDNDSVSVTVTINQHELTKRADGWTLLVRCVADDAMNQMPDDEVFAQLSFISVIESTRVFINGVQVAKDPTTNERIFQFDFGTTWDVDAQGRLYLDGFSAEGVTPHPYSARLSGTFDLVYAIKRPDDDTVRNSGIDLILGNHLLPDDVLGLYHEQISLNLGVSMDGLWSRARSVVGEQNYLRYDEDLIRTYATNQPKKDAEGKIVYTIVDGSPVIEWEHMAGDPWLDDNGDPVYIHRAGSVVHVNGQPVIANPRTIQRQVELILLDGIYYFATGAQETSYRDGVPDVISLWAGTTLAPVRERLLENSDLEFHPKSTLGPVEVVVDGGDNRVINAEQSFTITLFVSDSVSRDDVAREAMRVTTRQTIKKLLEASLVTEDTLTRGIKAALGDGVIGIDLSGLGGAAEYSVVSLVDESARLCIGQRLMSLPNGQYGVEDSINVYFERHQG